MDTVFSAPLSVFISITSRCNLKCLHCCVYEDARPGPDLTTREWKGFFHELEALKVFRLRISGGEPLMRPDFFDLLDDLNERPMRLCINTNATLVDRRAAENLSGLNRVDEVMVSLDGSKPEVHDALRGEGSFEKMKRGVGLLVEAGLPVSFYCTVTRLNLEDLSNIAYFAASFRAGGVKFNDLIVAGRGLVHETRLKVAPKELMAAAASLRKFSDERGLNASGTIFDVTEIFEDCKLAAARDAAESNTLCGCGALKEECAIRSDGAIIPCDRLPHLIAGNVKEKNLGETWRESPIFKDFRARRGVKLSRLPHCRGCPYTAACTGGCPAVSYPFTRDILAPDFSGCYLRFLSGESSDLGAAYRKVSNVRP